MIDLIYPPSCAHCGEELNAKVRLCAECLEQLTLLPLEGHCVKCFASIAAYTGTCLPCRKVASPFRKIGACFDPQGPAKAISGLYNSGYSHSVAKEIAAYMCLQQENLRFPEFDMITTVPEFFSRPLELVGKELARLLTCPYIPLLRRLFVPEPQFKLKKRCTIINKKVLLLAMSYKRPELLQAAGWALDKGRPETIYGMIFCAPY